MTFKQIVNQCHGMEDLVQTRSRDQCFPPSEKSPRWNRLSLNENYSHLGKIIVDLVFFKDFAGGIISVL